ncbi:MAG: 4-alpha-glucanotransferase, partial [Pseudomonadota bacterium]
AVLADIFAAWPQVADAEEQRAHHAFRAERGDDLISFATFEALSHAMAKSGRGAGSARWPADLATRSAPGVTAFANEQADAIGFHAWLQFIADRQLAEVQRSARAAGMRIGLYLDLAVGTAPDGHANWADPDLSLKGVTVGAPPDLFSTEGQSWGLAPLAPGVLQARRYAPYRAMLAAVMRHAGAVRIDHAMGLERLWLVPHGETAKRGAYVRQPGLVDEVVAATHRHQTIAIGEDLGIVPPGFRERMNARRLFSMRIAMFEREGARGRYPVLRPPARYPGDALACVSTHDFAPLEAWWGEDDLAIREALGTLSQGNGAAERRDRHDVKVSLMNLMGLPPRMASEPLTDTVVVAYHRMVARTACRMMAVRLEDVLGGKRLVNLPGTDREHPNWRHTLPLDVDAVITSPLLSRVLSAVRAVRP